MGKQRVRSYQVTDVYFHLTKEIKQQVATMHLLGIKQVMLDLPTYKQEYKKTRRHFNINPQQRVKGMLAYPSENYNVIPGSIHKWVFKIYDN